MCVRQNKPRGIASQTAPCKVAHAALNASKPLKSRVEFLEALAALATEFPEDMQRKVTGGRSKSHGVADE